MDALAVQNMLRNCRGLPPQQQQQQQRRKVVEEEEEDSSYSSSDDASEDSDLTNDHEYENHHQSTNHPSTNRHPNSAFMVMTPRKQHHHQQQQHNHYQNSVNKGASTPSTVHMSTYGYHSPSSTIRTPDHDAPPGLANFPKMPNRPPPHTVSVPPTPGSLAEALGMMIDPTADETAYIREEGEAAVPVMPWNEHCSAVKYHTTGMGGSTAPRPGSLAEALGLMIDPNPHASYIRKQGEAPTPIMPWNENCSAVKYHSTTSATAHPRPGSLAEALGLMIDPNPGASYIRKKGAGATPIMPWNENCSAVKYHTTWGTAAQPRPGSLAEALGLMIDPSPDASYIRKEGSEATPIMPWNENCSAVKYHTTLPSGRASAPRPGSLAEALGLMVDPNPDASYIRKQGEAATPIMPWNENCSAVKYHKTVSSGAAPQKGSLAEALGLMIDPNPGASYIRKQGEAPTPIMPWNENCSAVKYHTTSPIGRQATTAARPGSLAEALGLKIDPNPNASYIRKQGEAATPIMPWNEHCSAVKYHTTRPTGGPAASPRKGSLAEALGLKIDPNPEASYIRKQGEAATPIMPWNENCSAVKYHTVRPTGGPTAAPRKGSLAEALGLKIDMDPGASYIRKQGESPTPIMPWNEKCSAVKYHTTPSGRGATAVPRPGSLAEALGLKIDPSPQASYIRKHGEAPTPIMPWNENCSAVKYHTTLPSGQVAGPRPGSLAEALGLKIDPNPRASYIRKEGEAATPIMPWNENCSAVRYHTTLPSGQAAGPRPGSLAEALGLKIDPNPQASYIRKEGEVATPIMPWNENCSAVKYHTIPSGSSSSNNNRSQPVGGKKKKKSLMDVVMSRVDSAQPGSLAAALGMKIDDSNHAAPIREVGRNAPPTQSHYGTTFGYSTTSGAKPKKSLMEAVVTRVRSNSIDEFEEENVQEQQRADARLPSAKPKKSLMDAVVTRVRSNSIDEFEEENAPKPKKSLMDAVMISVVDARRGSLADALSMKIDASYQAPAIREKGNRAPPVQTHYGTTFIGDHHDKSGAKTTSFADMVFARMEGSERSQYSEKQKFSDKVFAQSERSGEKVLSRSERSAYSAPGPQQAPAETLSSSPPPPVASIWLVADMTMKSRSKKQKKKKMPVP